MLRWLKWHKADPDTVVQGMPLGVWQQTRHYAERRQGGSVLEFPVITARLPIRLNTTIAGSIPARSTSESMAPTLSGGQSV